MGQRPLRCSSRGRRGAGAVCFEQPVHVCHVSKGSASTAHETAPALPHAHRMVTQLHCASRRWSPRFDPMLSTAGSLFFRCLFDKRTPKPAAVSFYYRGRCRQLATCFPCWLLPSAASGRPMRPPLSHSLLPIYSVSLACCIFTYSTDTGASFHQPFFHRVVRAKLRRLLFVGHLARVTGGWQKPTWLVREASLSSQQEPSFHGVAGT